MISNTAGGTTDQPDHCYVINFDVSPRAPVFRCVLAIIAGIALTACSPSNTGNVETIHRPEQRLASVLDPRAASAGMPASQSRESWFDRLTSAKGPCSAPLLVVESVDGSSVSVFYDTRCR